jgi:hypothetical protein
LIVDHSSFQLYKVARGDHTFWIPGFGTPLSVLVRFGGKAIADFTGLPTACRCVPSVRPLFWPSQVRMSVINSHLRAVVDRFRAHETPSRPRRHLLLR